MKYYSYKSLTRRLNKVSYLPITLNDIKGWLIDLDYLNENEPTYKAQGLFYYNKKGKIKWAEIVVKEIEDKYFIKKDMA